MRISYYAYHLVMCHFPHLMSTLTLQLDDDSGIHKLQLYCHRFSLIIPCNLQTLRNETKESGQAVMMFEAQQIR